MASISKKHEELLKKLLNKRDGNRLYTYAALADLFAIGCWLYIEKKGNIASKIHLTVFRAIIENLGDCKESKKIEKQIQKIKNHIKKYKDDEERMKGLFKNAWPHHELKELIGD